MHRRLLTPRRSVVRPRWCGPRAAARSQRRLSARWLTPGHLAAHRDVRIVSERMVAATPAEGYAGCCEAIARLDLREELSSISAPTLAIADADDPATAPAKLQEIVARILGSRLLVVDCVAHLANAEPPGIITTPALIAHLEQL